jgi:hypothetical protein
LINSSTSSSLAIKATTEALMAEGFECSGYVVDISNKEQVYEVAGRFWNFLTKPSKRLTASTFWRITG